MPRSRPVYFMAVLCALLAACSDDAADTTADTAAAPADAASSSGANTPLLSYSSFELDNGLDVIFHVDDSDPVVAVSLTAHVGSAREVPGRTGFAHLFEHLLFLESENLGKGGLDRLTARIGGSGANGSTNRDRTNYLQTVPNNALEKMLWAEADKLGWFINTVTEPVLAKEKQVVKNEKRQNYDNRPYGHLSSVLRSHLYAGDHPYHWEVIGSLDDLQAATLDDVKTFYRSWYTPNNVTLVVAGDFDPVQARAWVKRYFDEIPRGPEIEPQQPRAAQLEDSIKLFHEDNFAAQPLLATTWPVVPEYHRDSYALTVLAGLLANDKRAPLNAVLVDEQQLTSDVTVRLSLDELAGEFTIVVRAFDGVDLDTVQAALDEGFTRFETEGVDADALQRVKIEQEVAFYNRLQSVLGKGASLAQYAIFAGDPGFADTDLARLQAVTAADVMRVYETFIRNRPAVTASFVPRGRVALALEGSRRAAVVEEQVVVGAEDEVDPDVVATYEPTPSEIDRSVEPPAGPTPVVTPPAVWRDELGNGLEVLGITDAELPLVEFELAIDGGHLFDTVEANGVANLVGEMLTRGTRQRSPAELQEAIAGLGAEIGVDLETEALVVRGRVLARNFDAVVALLTEMLLEPRWDPTEFELARARVTSQIVAQQSSPLALADLAAGLVTYGAADIRAHGTLGSRSSVAAITLDDLKTFHGARLAPQLASFRVVGDVTESRVLEALRPLEKQWAATGVTPPAPARPPRAEQARIYFYDVPGAKQSVFAFTHAGPLRTDDDYYAATVANYRLGGGGFASRLTQSLREDKGYTYGIRSRFEASARDGRYTLFSPIRSNVTPEATALVRSILQDYAATFSDADLAVTRSFFSNARARQFESYGAKLDMLTDIDLYNLPVDYVTRQAEIVDAMTTAEIRRLAREHIRAEQMNYVMAGDGATQLERLQDLGMGEPVLVNDMVDRLMD